MQAELMLQPMVVVMLLTFVVWLGLYRTRIGGMRRARIHPQRLATRARKSEVVISEAEQRVSDNFMNLCELPVIFYALCLALFVTGEVNAVNLALAWSFAVSRIVHSFIHVTYNRVLHRFAAYVFGGVLLLLLALRTGWALV